MKKAENGVLLNMDELGQVTGGVTYEYGFYAVVIPDDEEDPYGAAMRLFMGGVIANAKRNGKSLEEAMDILKRDDVTDEVFRYYWDKTILIKK